MEAIIDGTEVITYSHQVIPDTGRNKPYQTKTVKVELSYHSPAFPGDVENYVATAVDGEFKGSYASGCNYVEATNTLRCVLAAASKHKFPFNPVS